MTNEIIEKHEHYRIILSNDKTELLFDWNAIQGLSISDFKTGVIEFARRCEKLKPKRAIIDARKLDQGSPALGWVSGQQKVEGEEEYMVWWSSEVAPIYNNSCIDTLAVATGNPNAPGELKDLSSGVEFKMGYFNELDDAKKWA